MLDRDGYRPNVGILLLNASNEVFWGKRVSQHAWQFPQGGIKSGESPEQAMYRELREEVGLLPSHVKILGRTRNWLRYEVPARWLKRDWRGNYRGQKQIWFLLRLVGRECDVHLRASERPEFDAWRWGELDEALVAKIKARIRENTTPRHVPAKVLQVRDIPRTKSNKIVELAVREAVHGRPVKNVEALANPEALEQFRDRPELAG